MIEHNSYQVVYGYKSLGKTARLTFETKVERDEMLIKTEGDMAIALVDIELEFDDNYNMVSNNTTVFRLTQNTK